ncbi:hypothetical protein FHU41_000654 [Psychromicrobium silvestre]|uniref:Uncharacterized protein n=1 Tax=Psychromicrobium silvestre TaxID=1645614 RepID=A0A7Y9LRT9_9MICC|nr:hypothetical protein [Psychromicrobium silvestre]
MLSAAHLNSLRVSSRSSELPSMNLSNTLNTVRSNPAGTDEMIVNMVIDGDADKVHRYSGPDGKAIPRVKQLLG